MPTYEYRCRSCGHRFEEFQSITAGALRKCPKCGRMTLERLIGPGAGVIFKGSGFFATDYGNKAGNNPGPKDSKDSKPAGADSKNKDD